MENRPHRESATPEEIWNILRDVSVKQKEFDQRMEEGKKEADRQTEEIKKLFRETDRQMKETDRRLKKLDSLFNSQWGKLMESLVEGDLVSLLRQQGIAVQSTYPRVSGRRNGEHYEYDILAANGEEVVVVVEVKTTLQAKDVTHFLKKLDNFTGWVTGFKGMKVLGAVAFLKADATVAVYAERQGLYVIRATGSSASIINQADFKPRVFY